MSGVTGDLKAAYDVLYYLVFHFSRAVMAFLQRDSYLFWPFIVSTIVIMMVAAGYAARSAADGRGWRGHFSGYFSRGIWWHPSARADYRLYFANALLLPVVFGWLMFGDTHIAGLMNSLLGAKPAEAAAGSSASVAGRIAFTLLFFVAYDFGRFVAHCLLHDVPALWEFHKVHHSAEVLTPITAFRVHPFDLLIMAWVPALLTGLTTWVFNRVSDAPVSFFSFLGLHVMLWAINLIDNLRHSNVWITYGPVAGRWIVSPAHHQLHHSYEPMHMGCNRGFSLAVWDRIYGTLRMPDSRPEKFRLGLGDGSEPQWHSVRRMYLLPFSGCARALRGLFGRRSLREGREVH